MNGSRFATGKGARTISWRGTAFPCTSSVVTMASNERTVTACATTKPMPALDALALMTAMHDRSAGVLVDKTCGIEGPMYPVKCEHTYKGGGAMPTVSCEWTSEAPR